MEERIIKEDPPMYIIDNEKLNKRPEMRIADKIYTIDNRLSTFQRINERLTTRDGISDFEIIIAEALGTENLQEINNMDLSYGVMHDIVIIILAAIQDVSAEEARSRFRREID